jgi:poly(glycerol-phosphate) alpha-glucosyltransferase
MENIDKLKILYVSPSVSRLFTGVYEVEKNIALELYKLGINIEVHGMIDQYTQEDLINWLPIKPYLYNSIGPQKIGYNPNYLSSLNKSKANVGHVHSLWSFTAYALYKWAKNNNKPYLFTVNAYLFESALKESRLKKKIALYLGLHKVIGNADCIQVNTMNEYKAVRDLGFTNTVCLISNGVQLPDLKLKTLPPWNDNPYTKGKKILLYLSRIHPQKGVNLLVESWKELSKQSKLEDWHLVIVGFSKNKSIFESQLVKIVNDYNLNTSITLLPGQFDNLMKACYANCNGFILPSFNEGTSIAALNALAFSKPAIITSGCNLTDSFNLGAALQIESNVESIGEGIINLINMTDTERNIMGQNGRKLVEEKYSWESVSFKILEIYKWLYNRKTTAIPSTIIID